jgi:hypothetical protein
MFLPKSSSTIIYCFKTKLEIIVVFQLANNQEMALVKITHQSVSASPIFEFIYSYSSTFQYIILHHTKRLFKSLYKSQDKKLLE